MTQINTNFVLSSSDYHTSIHVVTPSTTKLMRLLFCLLQSMKLVFTIDRVGCFEPSYEGLHSSALKTKEQNKRKQNFK